MTIHDRGDKINKCMHVMKEHHKNFRFTTRNLTSWQSFESDRQTDRQTDDEKDRVFLPKEFDSCRAVKRASAPH